MDKIFLATDLDRTILPNGDEPESPQARERFRKLAAHDAVTLAYVSGRSGNLIQTAINKYDIPIPDFAIGDVGTSIYEAADNKDWSILSAWSEEITPDWQGHTWDDMKALFDDIEQLRLQDDSPDAQNTFKLSYYTDPDVDKESLLAEMNQRAEQASIKASLIFSIDEQKNVGLLDVLPESATKLHAVQFLRRQLGYDEDRTVFCGDSGNDLPALTSGLHAVMVKNTHPDVIKEVTLAAQQRGFEDRIYLARGDFLGMNGNYTAGVLEGVAHFFPQTMQLIK